MALFDADTNGTRAYGVRYPSPFFDLAQTYLPTNIHDLHLWCRYYFLTNPWIHAAVSKMAEYPVTPIRFLTESDTVRERYERLIKQLKLRQFQVEIGLDFYTYGSAFASVFYPLVKYLVCRNCKRHFAARNYRTHYKWRSLRFYLTCPSCGTEDYATPRDTFPRNVHGIRMIRWNPENVDIRHNEAIGLSRYYYRIPRAVSNDIHLGDPAVIEEMPEPFLQAVREGKSMEFAPENLYHLKRSTLANKDQGWGMPLLYPVLKDAFLLQVLKKAQEAICNGYIVPFRAIAPGQVTAGTDSPFQSINLTNWRTHIQAEIARWRMDPNYIATMPMATNLQQWSGDAKALMLNQEIRQIAESLATGCGVPIEFVSGGLSWTGSNTSLRALENMFIGYNDQRSELVFDFALGNAAAFMGWSPIKGEFESFKMADDLQKSMFFFQLNQAQKISDQTLLEEVGKEAKREHTRMRAELDSQLAVQRKSQVATADIQGEVMLHTARFQARAAAMQGAAQPGTPPGGEGASPQGGGEAPDPTAAQEPEAPTGNVPTAMRAPLPVGGDLQRSAQQIAGKVRAMEEPQRQQFLMQLKTQNPQLAGLVVAFVQADQGSQLNPLDAQKSPVPAQGGQRSEGRTL